MSILDLLLVIFSITLPVTAQFNFFEQMFGGQQQAQQAPQNVGSDSAWYRQQYDAGRIPLPSTLSTHWHIEG